MPANVTATPVSSSQINLSWLASTDNIAVVAYDVYRNGVLIASPTGTTYNDTGLSNTSAYTYVVKARDAAGNTSGPSVPVTSTTSDTQPPTAPTGLMAFPRSSGQIDLYWRPSIDNIGVTGYDVYRGGVKVGSTTSVGFSDTGLTASTAYSYTVRAKDAAGNVSADSNTATATTRVSNAGGSVVDTQPSTIPTGLTATAISATQINLSWTASTDKRRRNRVRRLSWWRKDRFDRHRGNDLPRYQRNRIVDVFLHRTG